MTNQQILEKAIQKALDNGWRPDKFEAADINFIEMTWRNVILKPDFAKALWGDGYAPAHYCRDMLVVNPFDETITEYEEATRYGKPRFWQYHLQNMVIADDPIKYLGDNLELNREVEIKT